MTTQAPSRTAPRARTRVLHILVYFAAGAIVVLFLGFRTLIYQPLYVPSGSMEPTLLPGDYFFVSKFAYGYSRYSFPFSADLFSGRIFAAEPRRGDVVVFRRPRDSVDFVKRIIGLPGDRVQIVNGQIVINDVAVKREQIDDFVETDDSGKVMRVKRWHETLPNGVSYEALDLIDNGFLDNTPVFEVPAGNYFVLGDNLDNSTDSRVPSQIGYVPFENLVGRVAIIFWSTDKAGAVRNARIGKVVR